MVAPVDNKKHKEQNVTLKNAIGSTNHSDRRQRTHAYTHGRLHTSSGSHKKIKETKNLLAECRLLSLLLSATSCLATPSYHTKRGYSLLNSLQVTLLLLHSRRVVVVSSHCCNFWLAATGLSLALALYAGNTHPRNVSNRLHCNFRGNERATVFS